MTPVVASIGCSDPWNAAGIGLDVRALAACGARAVTVVAGVTAQDADGVLASLPIPATLIDAQFRALAAANVRALRIGALLDAASVEGVARFVRAAGLPAVYDPVLAPSAGGRFANAATLDAIRDVLVPAVTLVTPNLAEAAAFTGAAVDDVAAMERAAETLRASGARAALVKGGHLRGKAVDVLADRDGVVAFEDARLPGTMRGTGCLLACAIAAALARGMPLRAAIESARAFVRERFATAETLGPMRVAF